MRIRLAAVEGPHAGEEWSFEVEKGLTIGRTKNRDVCLRLDDKVSRYHAQISVFRSECYLEDMGSTNGTRVGGERIDRRIPLKKGQVFQVGRTRLQIDW